MTFKAALTGALNALPIGLGQAGLSGSSMAYSVGGATPLTQCGNAKQLGGYIQGALTVANCRFWICDAVSSPEYWCEDETKERNIQNCGYSTQLKTASRKNSKVF